MSDAEIHGPIDFLLLEFPELGDGSVADALLDLVDAGIIRIWDLLIIQKQDDGSFAGIDLTDVSADGMGGFAAFSGARSGLLGDDDVSQAADTMQPGTVAALLLYENAWAIPFVGAARAAGGEVIASARIPAQDVIDALDALEG
jgi:hypothetical protein